MAVVAQFIAKEIYCDKNYCNILISQDLVPSPQGHAEHLFVFACFSKSKSKQAITTVYQ